MNPVDFVGPSLFVGRAIEFPAADVRQPLGPIQQVLAPFECRLGFLPIGDIPDDAGKERLAVDRVLAEGNPDRKLLTIPMAGR